MKKAPRPKTAATETCLTPSEAAHLLHIHVNTLSAWRRAGTGPRFTQHGPRSVRYRLGDLLSFQPEATQT